MRDLGLPADRLPDDVLLEGFAAGDEELAVTFVRRFQRKVFGVALAVCGDAALAEDVSQQAFERAWRHASLYDQRRGGVSSWLNVITRNAGIDATRRRRPSPVDPTDLLSRLIATGDDPEQAAVHSEQVGELRAALAALPVAQARCVVMASICGLTAAEIAEVESIPLGTAKTRIRAAMSGLRTAMPTLPEDSADRKRADRKRADTTREDGPGDD